MTIRKYKDCQVPDALVAEIVSQAMLAPTCGNMQLYTVIATRDPQKLKEMAGYHFNQPAAAGAPLILTVCADFNRFTRWCRLSDANPGYDNFHSFIVAMTDAVILAQQIVTVADAKGLGSCYLGTVNYNAAQIAEILELPDLVVPVAALSMGYPDEEGDKTERLPVEAVLHFEKYRDDSDDEVMTLFKAKDHFAPNRKFVEENGKQSLAQVFTDIRYPRNVNESVSKSFADLLKTKHFTN